MELRSITRKCSLLTLNFLSYLFKVGGVPILTYHSIDDSGSLLSTSPRLFSQQMRFLKEKDFRVISLKMLVEHFSRQAPLHPRSVVLTFDDGYKNNYEMALPILKSFDFSATFFIATDFIGKKSPWMKNDLSVDLLILSWDEIKEMAENGMDIQPHSCSHRHLPQLARDEIEWEMSESRGTIEREVGGKADLFCYPYGEFNETCIDALCALQFKAAVTIRYGRKNSMANLYALQRVGSAHFQDMTAFKICLNGLYDWHIMAKNLVLRKKS